MNSYMFGFNGQEKDNEWHGEGNMYSFEYRVHDPRLGRFLSVDPLSKDYPFYSPYAFAGNKPVWCLDLEGLEDVIGTIIYDENGNILHSEMYVLTADEIEALKDLGVYRGHGMWTFTSTKNSKTGEYTFHTPYFTREYTVTGEAPKAPKDFIIINWGEPKDLKTNWHFELVVEWKGGVKISTAKMGSGFYASIKYRILKLQLQVHLYSRLLNITGPENPTVATAFGFDFKKWKGQIEHSTSLNDYIVTDQESDFAKSYSLGGVIRGLPFDIEYTVSTDGEKALSATLLDFENSFPGPKGTTIDVSGGLKITGNNKVSIPKPKTDSQYRVRDNTDLSNQR